MAEHEKLPDMWEVGAAVRAAKKCQDAIEYHIKDMAMLMVGRLRIAEVSPYALKALKRELEDFDARSGTWK